VIKQTQIYYLSWASVQSKSTLEFLDRDQNPSIWIIYR